MNIGKENESVEFKKSTAEMRTAAVSVASILNKGGKGTLYFGVLDSGEVCGLSVGKSTLREITNDLLQAIEPTPLMSVRELRTAEGLSFVEVEFSGNDAPYSAGSRYSIRVHDTDRKMTQAQLENYILERRRDYAEWENKSSGHDKNVLDIKTFNAKIENGVNGRRIPKGNGNIEATLRKLSMLCENDTLNNAGFYLFSATEPLVLKMARFAGTSKTTIVDLKRFEGNIFTCIDAGLSYIAEGINWNVEFDGSAVRKEIPEIPLAAVREIVVNAFAHGNYSSNSNFEIDIFKDRVSVFSPGEFPRGLSPKDFANNLAEPVVMNPKIVNVLFKCGEIESFGTGFARAFELCRAANVRYEYRRSKQGFRFTFRRPAVGESANATKMSKTEKRVFELVSQDTKLTADGMASELGVSSKTVYRALKTLKEKDLIERIGSDNSGMWIAG